MSDAEQNTHDRWAASYNPIRDTSDPNYDEAWRWEQCGGCKAYRPLDGPLGADWGACTSAASPADGTLRFEHDGCEAFEPGDDDGTPFR